MIRTTAATRRNAPSVTAPMSRAPSRRVFLTTALHVLSGTLTSSLALATAHGQSPLAAPTNAPPLSTAPPTNPPAPAASPPTAKTAAPATTPTVRFRKTPQADDRLQAILKIETTGELKLNADGRKVTRSPVEATAEIAFDERLAADGLTLRYYTKAEATLKVGSKSFPSRLRDNRRYIAARLEPLATPASPAPSTAASSAASTAASPAASTLDSPSGSPSLATPGRGVRSDSPTQEISTAARPALRGPGNCLLYSPQGPLQRDELELLQVPGNGPPLTELLGDGELSPGDTWPIPPETLAQLLWLEAVSSSAVNAVLKSIDGPVALIALEGAVAGAVGGVATDIDLTGKLNYDTQQQLVVWCALSIKENRSIGHAEPGFETTTQLRLATRRGAPSPPLAATAIAGLPLAYERGQSLLEYISTEGRFQMLLDRRWRLMVDRHDLAVLRLVDRGDLVAQCNASRLPALAPGKELPLDELQEDIRQSLGKNLRQFIEASVSRTDDGLRILRVAAAGEAAEIAVQWNYYHVSNAQGQRLALVFTLESEQLDRFAEIDRPLAASITFLPDPEPTNARRQVAAAADGNAPTRPPSSAPAPPASLGMRNTLPANSPTATPTKSVTRKPDTASPAAGKPSTGKRGAGTSETSEPAAGKSKAGKAESRKAEAGKAEAGKAEAGKVETGKAAATQPGTGKSSRSKLDSADASPRDANRRSRGDVTRRR